MAIDPREILRTGRVEQAGVAAAPLAGTRSQRIQRLQFGAFGLATMILLVGLANIIMNSAQENQAASVPEDLAPVGLEDVPPPVQSNPLADAGVAPELPIEPEAAEENVPLNLPEPELGDVPPPAD